MQRMQRMQRVSAFGPCPRDRGSCQSWQRRMRAGAPAHARFRVPPQGWKSPV